MENTEKRKLMTVRRMGDLLGLKKTERYYLVKKGYFEVIRVCGQMWVVCDSFEKWYANQVKYKKVTGEEQGKELREWSYSPQEIASLLGISDGTVYDILKNNQIETVIVDFWKRVPKEAFEKWYQIQDRYRIKKQKESPEVQSGSRPVRERRHALLTQTEAAQMAGVSRTTILRWVEKGYVHEILVGNMVRIPRKDFEKWLEQRKKTEGI